MKIDGKNVELSEREQDTVDRAESYRVVMKMKKADAMLSALDMHKGTPSKQFVEWATKGSHTMTDGAVTEVKDDPEESGDEAA